MYLLLKWYDFLAIHIFLDAVGIAIYMAYKWFANAPKETKCEMLEREEQERKAYEDSLFWLDLGDGVKYYDTNNKED